MKMRGKALMSNSLRIAWKDLMELFRNRLGLVMLILMPIFMMGMVGFIFPSNNSLNHVSVGLVNQDAGFGGSTVGSQVFLTVLNGINNQTGMLDISNATNLDALKESVQRGRNSRRHSHPQQLHTMHIERPAGNSDYCGR